MMQRQPFTMPINSEGRYASHREIIDFLTALGFTSDQGGICDGMDKALRRFLIKGELESADRFLTTIYKLVNSYTLNEQGELVGHAIAIKNFDSAKAQIARVQEKVKNQEPLSQDENAILTMYALLQVIDLQFNGGKHPGLFPETMHQLDDIVIGALVLDDKISTVTVDPTMKTANELVVYFESLTQQINTVSESIKNQLSIQVDSPDHAITLAYQKSSDVDWAWYIPLALQHANFKVASGISYLMMACEVNSHAIT